MSIKKNPRRRTYDVRWREDGHQRSKSFKTKAEATDFDARLRVDRQRGAYISGAAEKVTFSECAEQWLTSSKTRRHSTVLRHRGILNLHLLPVLGSKRLNSIRRAEIQRLIDRWTESGLERRTIDRHLAVLKGVMCFAVEQEWLSSSPMDRRYDLPLARDPHRHPLSLEEFECLLDKAGDQWTPLLYVAAMTGLRWGELVALNVGDLNWADSSLTVRVSKTKAGRRTVSLSGRCTAYISQHLQATGRTGAQAEQPLFTSPQGHRLNYSNFTKRVFKPAAEQAGLSDLTPHDLRRTSASWLVEVTANHKVVQERLGHADIRTTLNLYAAASKEAHKDTAEALEDLLRNQPGESRKASGEA